MKNISLSLNENDPLLPNIKMSSPHRGRTLRLSILRLVFLISFLSACTAITPDTTTFILEYPPPRIETIALAVIAGTEGSQQLTLNGTISTTLNPSVNDDFMEYWLFLSSNESATFSNIPTAAVSKLNDLATEKPIGPSIDTPYFFASLSNVSARFARTTVNDYHFSNTSFPGSAPFDYFYEVAVRSWGSNDSYSVAYKNNGWIISQPSETLEFYVGQFISCPTVELPTTSSGNRSFGYRRAKNNANTTCSEIFKDTSGLDISDIIFYTTSQEALFITVSESAGPDSGILKPPLTTIGEIYDLSSLEEREYFKSGDNVPIAPLGEVYLIRHGGDHYSKIRITSFTAGETDTDSATMSIDILYTGDRWESAPLKDRF